MRDRDANAAGFDISTALLGWYDLHARELPWRISPAARAAGIMPDPYRVWLSEIMLQQTTVAAVKSYFLRFTTLWPDVHALAAADDERVMAEWAGLGYYARARNLLKCARVIFAECGGIFPVRMEELLKLPGVGPYTAAAIAAIAFDQSANVVDGNVERVMSRLFDVDEPLPGAKKILSAHAATLVPDTRPGDYAQALMDLGATVCTPRNPACGLCPLRGVCLAEENGTSHERPRRAPKQIKPTRHGYAYVAIRPDGALLLERRAESGLLGGMLGWPGSDWTETPVPTPPLVADWSELDGEVRHTFTHFHLRLKVCVCLVPMDANPERGMFLTSNNFTRSDLPTVMRKVLDLARPSLEPILIETGSSAESPLL